MASVVSALPVTGSGPTPSVNSMLSQYVYSIAQSVISWSVTYRAYACAIISSAESQASDRCMSNSVTLLSYPCCS